MVSSRAAGPALLLIAVAVLVVVLVGRALDDDGSELLRGAPVIDAAPTAGEVPTVESSDGTLRADPAWVARTAARTEISEPVVRAYGTAAARQAEDQSGCRIGWTTLAGIGQVETIHGQFGGATVRQDGTTTRRILGPPLDGTDGTRAIAATPASTRLHGDADWDRAMGPMQFIPTTWERWGADGDGNGTKDPFDVDDAALAAARYLCAEDRDLSTPQGWSSAVFTYNNSGDYVRNVLGHARDAALA